MSDWKEYKLSNIMDIIGGGTPKTSNAQYWKGTIPWLSVVDFNTGLKFVYKTEKTITEKGLKESSTKYLNSGDIIISARGTVGALAVLSTPMTFNQSCYGLKAKQGLSCNNFLYYLVKDTVSELQTHTYGAVFDTITKDTFENILVRIPPLPEQESIAEILSSLDDKIDLLHRNNKTLEQLAETLFRQNVLSASEDYTTLSEYISVQGGYAFKSKDFLEDGSVGIVKITNISFEYIDTISTQYINKDVASTIHKKFKIIPGSFLIAMTGAEIGKIGIVGKTNKDLYLNQRVGMLIDKFPNSSIIGYLFLKSPEGQDHIINTASGSAQENISTTGIESMIVPKISTKKLSDFCVLIKPIFDKKISNLYQIYQLESFRDTLLPKLMSGSVRVGN